MRLLSIVFGLCVLLLAGCGGPREPDIPPVTLDGAGIQPTISGLRIDFGRAQVGVIDTMARLLGTQPAEVTLQPGCGAGPITAARWEDGLTLNFSEGSFVGWVNTDPTLPVAGGFRAGQPRLEMPQVSFQVTTLGNEFQRGDVFGILDQTETQIAFLWAGTTCFFR